MTTNGSGGDALSFWCALVRSKTSSLAQPSVWEADALKQASAGLATSQVKLAMSRYIESAPFPFIRDFLDYLQGVRLALPSPGVSAALVSGEEALKEIADEIEILRGAWFPDEATKERIEALESRLVEAFR